MTTKISPTAGRALEVDLFFGDTLLESRTFRDQPEVTIGEAFERVGPFGQHRTCDLNVPSLELPARRYPLAVAMGLGTCRYQVLLHPSFGGVLARSDGSLLGLDALFASGFALEEGALPGTRWYPLAGEETIWIVHQTVTFRLRYVPLARVAPTPLLDRANPAVMSSAMFSFFLHALLLVALVGEPVAVLGLEDLLQRHDGRMRPTIFAPAPRAPKQAPHFLSNTERLRGGGAFARSTGNPGSPRGHRPGGRSGPGDRSRVDSILGMIAEQSRPGALGSGGELLRGLTQVQGPSSPGGDGLGGLEARGAGPGGGALGAASVGAGPIQLDGPDGSRGLRTRITKSETQISIESGRARLASGLDRELIRQVVEAHREQVRYCYEAQLAQSPGLFGKVQLEWLIDAGGAVRSVQINESTVGRAVADCVAARIKGWRFPPPKGGGTVLVRYPFVFRRSG